MEPMKFGKPPIPDEGIVKALTTTNVFQIAPMNRGDFKRVKARMKNESARVLTALGSQFDMESLYESHPREFLYDFVWLDRAGAMVLAVDCEASMYVDDVLYDFRKLFHAKAPMKLLLFSDSAQLRREGIVHRIEDELNAYPGHVPGEEYIVVQFCNFTSGRLEAYRYAVPTDKPTDSGCTLTKFLSHHWSGRPIPQSNEVKT